MYIFYYGISVSHLALKLTGGYSSDFITSSNTAKAKGQIQ